MKYIRYTAGYKFQLEDEYEHDTGMRPATQGGNRFVRIDAFGILTIAPGYAWDGASGPAIDTPSFMRGSLVHDALYQLMRLGVLSKDRDRRRADEILHEIVREDGMPVVRAWWVYLGVRTLGGLYLRSPGNGNTIITAPRPPDDRHDYS